MTTTASPSLHCDAVTGRVLPLEYRASPNADDRPPGVAVDLLVIHAISLPPGEFGGPWIDALFRNRLPPGHHPYFADIHRLRVSAHLLVRRNGAMIQYVPLTRRAWHAGESCHAGRTRCNDFSIGIELEGLPGRPFEAAQYRSLARLAAAIATAYPSITPERMVGHSDIAPGRKQDPGAGFDWERFRGELAAASRHA